MVRYLRWNKPDLGEHAEYPGDCGQSWGSGEPLWMGERFPLKGTDVSAMIPGQDIRASQTGQPKDVPSLSGQRGHLAGTPNLVNTWAYQLLGAELPLPCGGQPEAPGVSAVVLGSVGCKSN